MAGAGGGEIVERLASGAVSLRVLLALILLPLPLEAVHYAFLMYSYGVPGWARSPWDIYPRVLMVSLALGPLRPLVEGAALWLSYRVILGEKITMKGAVGVSALAGPVRAVVLASLTPLLEGAQLGTAIALGCTASIMVFTVVAGFALYVYRLRSARGQVRRSIEAVKAAVAAIASAVIVYATPVGIPTLQCQLYGLLYSAAAPAAVPPLNATNATASTVATTTAPAGAVNASG